MSPDQTINNSYIGDKNMKLNILSNKMGDIIKSDSRYLLYTNSEYTVNFTAQIGFFPTVVSTLPDRKIRLIYLTSANLTGNGRCKENIIKVPYKTTNVTGNGSIDIFHTREQIFKIDDYGRYWDIWQFLEILTSKINSLKKCRMVMQQNYCYL